MPPNDNNKCQEHSGFMARILSIEKENTAMRTRLDSIFMRINITLGGVAVACILLVVNFILLHK